jgi:hypothetical protein
MLKVALNTINPNPPMKLSVLLSKRRYSNHIYVKEGGKKQTNKEVVIFLKIINITKIDMQIDQDLFVCFSEVVHQIYFPESENAKICVQTSMLRTTREF